MSLASARVRYIHGHGQPWPSLGHITARTHWVEEGVQGVVFPLCTDKPARIAFGWAEPAPCKTCDRLRFELTRVDIAIDLSAVTDGPVR